MSFSALPSGVVVRCGFLLSRFSATIRRRGLLTPIQVAGLSLVDFVSKVPRRVDSFGDAALVEEENSRYPWCNV